MNCIHCPHESLGGAYTVVLEVVAGIPFEDIRDMSFVQELLLTPDGRTDGGKDGRARTFFPVAKTQIEGLRLRRVRCGIVEPILIPHRRRGSNNGFEGLSGLIASPQSEKSGQGITTKDNLNFGAILRSHLDEFLINYLPHTFESLRCAIAKGRLTEHGRCGPRSQFVEPPVDMHGNESKRNVSIT